MRDLDNFHSLQERAWQNEKKLEERNKPHRLTLNDFTDRITSLANFLFSDRCTLHSYRQNINDLIKEYKNLAENCKHCIYSESIDCYDPTQTDSWAGRDPSECTIYTVGKSISTLYRMQGFALECLQHEKSNCHISLIRNNIFFLERISENFDKLEKSLKDVDPVIIEDKYWSSPAGCDGFDVNNYKGETKEALIKALEAIKEGEA